MIWRSRERFGGKRSANELLCSDGAVCRTALATPGLLNISDILQDQLKGGAISKALFVTQIPCLSDDSSRVHINSLLSECTCFVNP